MGAPGVASVIIRKEKVLVRHFREAGATTPANAKSPVALGVHQRLAWLILLERDVIREAEPGTFWLDEAEWEAGVQRRRKLAVIILAAAIAFAAAGYFGLFGARRP